MRKQIPNYENYFIYDNGDVLNISTNKILKGSIEGGKINLMEDSLLNM